MNNQTVSPTSKVNSTPSSSMTTEKLWLICGILSSILYVIATIVGALTWKEYDSISQSVSELMAIDSPSRPFVVPLFLLYNPLIIAFGWGIWKSAGQKQSRRILAGLLMGYGTISLIGPFVPMHMRGVPGSLTDTLHIAVTMILVLFIFLIIGFGSNTFGKGFRLYSIGTIVVLLIFGIWMGPDGANIAANLPTPLAGVKERVLIFSFLLWIVILAGGLLKAQSHSMKKD